MPIDAEFSGDFEREPYGSAEESKAENPLVIAHRAFRGRYLLAGAVGLALMAPAGAIGYFAMPPKFLSTGIIEVSPTLPMTMYQTADNMLPPMFDSFVETQASFVSAPRVLARAIDTEAMQEAGWPRGIEGLEDLKQTITVGRVRGAQLIFINAKHKNAKLAQSAANAVMESYMELHGDRSAIEVQAREGELSQRITELRSTRSGVTNGILAIAREYGTDDLSPIHNDALSELTELDNEKDRLIVQIDLLESQLPNEGDSAASSFEPERLAEFDAQLADLLDNLNRTDRAIEMNKPAMGPHHREMRRLLEQRESYAHLIDARVTTLRVELTGEGLGGKSVGLGRRLQQLRAAQGVAITQRERAAERTREIGTRRLEISRLKRDEDNLTDRLSETERELDKLRTEKPHVEQGRIKIVQRGELPHTPSTDKRAIVTMAAAGAGFGLGAGLIGLAGFMRRNYQYLDELNDLQSSAPLLGTLPNLEAPDQQQNQYAALAVHHIRNMLHVLSPASQDGGRAFTVTSAGAGEGKTSLCLALGMSFAVTGQRTLVLDADLIGQGLTKQFDLRTKPGLTDLVDNGADITHCIYESHAANLSILPVGSDPDFDPEQLAEQDFRRLVERLRDEFDTILIDTGPILGSLEADITCATADRVLVTVARGQTRRLVQASLARLRHLGASQVGLVFNRASMHDLTRSISHVSIHSESMRALPTKDSSEPRRPFAPLIEALGDWHSAPTSTESAPESAHPDQTHQLP